MNNTFKIIIVGGIEVYWTIWHGMPHIHRIQSFYIVYSGTLDCANKIFTLYIVFMILYICSRCLLRR